MRIWSFRRAALAICATATLLAGCGGAQPPIGVYSASRTTPLASNEQIFHYTGGKQSFKVPAGVTKVTINAEGASGAPAGRLYYGSQASGGAGGSVIATISVTPGERLAIFVGGSGPHGGFNGGGTGDYGHYGYGGGASDVRQAGDELADRVVVAGGGGGGGSSGYICYYGSFGSSCDSPLGGVGGDGGGLEGKSGGAGQAPKHGSGGQGGSQSSGGKGGTAHRHCAVGGRGRLGIGGDGKGCPTIGHDGGGGGGGYYGGGGGSGGGYGSVNHHGVDFKRWGSGGGGGGGSSFAESSATHVLMPYDTRNGDGQIVITW